MVSLCYHTRRIYFMYIQGLKYKVHTNIQNECNSVFAYIYYMTENWTKKITQLDKKIFTLGTG